MENMEERKDACTDEQQESKVERKTRFEFKGRAEKQGKATGWTKLAVASLLAGIASMCMGFYKMYWYNNGEYSWDEPINVYVGGDAYNFIINGTYATAFFVLAAMFVLAAIGLMGLHYISQATVISGNNTEE